jgi:hypothetical protein
MILHSSHFLLYSTPHTFYYPPLLTYVIILYSSHILSLLLTHFIILHSSHMLLYSTHTFYYPLLLKYFFVLYSSYILLFFIFHTFHYPPLLTHFIILHSSHLLLSSILHTSYSNFSHRPSFLTSSSYNFFLRPFLLLTPFLFNSYTCSVPLSFFYFLSSLCSRTHSVPSSLPLFFHGVKNNREFYNYLLQTCAERYGIYGTAETSKSAWQ